jgi:hypothetical protein
MKQGTRQLVRRNNIKHFGIKQDFQVMIFLTMSSFSRGTFYVQGEIKLFRVHA